jgi:hypothetical protein
MVEQGINASVTLGDGNFSNTKRAPSALAKDKLIKSQTRKNSEWMFFNRATKY